MGGKKPGRPQKTTVVDDKNTFSGENLTVRLRITSRKLGYLCQNQQSREDFTRVNTEGL